MPDRSLYSGSPTDVALVYGVVSGAYILLSDRLVAVVIDDPDLAATVQTAKGWLFVLGSALLIFALVRHSQESLERSNERLDRALQQTSVLHRILRHNLRNSCNVISGNAEIISAHVETDGGAVESGDGEVREDEIDDGALDGDVDDGSQGGQVDDEAQDDDIDEPAEPPDAAPDAEECLETIHEQTTQLVTITEKTRLLRDFVLDDQPTETVDVAAIVAERVAHARDRFPSATFETTLPDSVVIETDPRVGDALDELLENAVEHTDRDGATVRVELRQGVDGDVRIDVADVGPGMPEMERAVLEEGMENPTFHSEGLGLWIARTVVTQLDGDIRIVDNEPRGTIVRIVLPG